MKHRQKPHQVWAITNMASHVALIFFLGVVIRLLLSYSSFSEKIASRVEVSTPLTSWRRVTEGLFLHRMGISPYDGDTLHEPPLLLLTYDYLTQVLNSSSLPILFIVCDLFTSLMLYVASKNILFNMLKEDKKIEKAESAKKLALEESSVKNIPTLVMAIYLLSPFSILSCVGLATVVFSNFLISLTLLSTTCGWWLIAPVVLALETYKSFYSVMLLVPLTMYCVQMRSQGNTYTKGTNKAHIVLILATYALTFSGLMFTSYHVTQSWSFIRSTFGCIWAVPDLTPNIGLFWYFFNEVFEHFRIFFLWIFHLSAFIYIPSLAIRLRNDPMLLFFILTALCAIFKSYPSVGDVALYMALIPVWRHLFTYMKQYFLVGCIFISCTALAPVLWHLWIYANSANANFYFGITLGFNTGQIFLVTDLLFAHVKREYYLKHGDPKELEAKGLKLELR